MATPIPNRRIESQSQGPGPVTTYKLSPEELQNIIGKPFPKSHKKPIGMDTRDNEKIQSRKDEPQVAKIQKEDYLALRASGLSRDKAAKKLGTTLASIENYWLAKKWGIKTEEAEEVEIARYKEQKKKISEPAAPAPTPEKVEELKVEEPVNTPPVQSTQEPTEPEHEQLRMSVAVKQWVFNPGLKGKFVRVHGVDGEGAKLELQALVAQVEADRINISTFDRGEWVLRLHEFGENGLALEVCEQFTRYEMPADADLTLVE
jgi:type IV secretory pathway VirB10-like protein